MATRKRPRDERSRPKTGVTKEMELSNMTTTQFLGGTPKAWMIGAHSSAVRSSGQADTSTRARTSSFPAQQNLEQARSTPIYTTDSQDNREELHPQNTSSDTAAQLSMVPTNHHLPSNSASPVLANTVSLQKETTVEIRDPNPLLPSPAPSEETTHTTNLIQSEVDSMEQSAPHHGLGSQADGRPEERIPENVRLMELAARFGGIDELERRLQSVNSSPSNLLGTTSSEKFSGSPSAQSLSFSRASMVNDNQSSTRQQTVPLPSNAPVPELIRSWPHGQAQHTAQQQPQPDDQEQTLLKPSAHLSAVDAMLNLVRYENSLLGNKSSLAETRVKLLHDACQCEDEMYLTLHQLFSIHTSPKPSSLSITLSTTLSTYQLEGFRVLAELILPNTILNAGLVEWFSNFPSPLGTLLNLPSFRSTIYKDALRCIELLGKNFEDYKKRCASRRCPPLVDYIETDLGARSKVLQRIIFTAVQRAFWVGPYDRCFERASTLFSRNQAKAEQWKLGRTSSKPASTKHMVAYYNSLIAQYERLRLSHLNHLQGICEVGSTLERPAQLTRASMAPPQQSPRLQNFSDTTGPRQVAPENQSRYLPSADAARQAGQVSGANSLGSAGRPLQTAAFGNTASVSHMVPVTAQPNVQPYSLANSQNFIGNGARQTDQSQIAQQSYQTIHPRVPNNVLSNGQYIPPTSRETFISQSPIVSSPHSFDFPVSPAASGAQMVQLNSPNAQNFPTGPLQGFPTRRQSIPRIPVTQREVPPVSSHLLLRSNTLPQSLEVLPAAAGRPSQVFDRQGQPSCRNASTPVLHHFGDRVQPSPSTPLLPPAGLLVPNLSHPNLELHNLHLAHLRDAELICTDNTGAVVKDVRYYQYLKQFAQEPILISPQHRNLNGSFIISQEAMSLIPKDEPRPFGAPPSRKVYPGSQLYRFRCIKSTTQQPLSESQWFTEDIAWPNNTTITLNGIPLELRRKGHFGKDLPVDITSLIKEGMNSFGVSIVRIGQLDETGPAYSVAIEVIEVSDLFDVRSKTPHIERDKTEARIKEQLSTTDPDVEVVNGNIAIGVIDPFSSCLIDTPVRGKTCKHYECFDLDIFLQTRLGSPSKPDLFKCPICDGDARPQSLVIDDWFADILKKIKDMGRTDVKAIMLNDQAAWWIKEAEIEGESGDGTGRRYEDARAASSTKRRQSEMEVIEID